MLEDAPAQLPPETVVAVGILASLATGSSPASPPGTSPPPAPSSSARPWLRSFRRRWTAAWVIEQAKGRLSVELGVDPSKALEVMRAYARSRPTGLKEMAQRVRAGKLRAEGFRTSG